MLRRTDYIGPVIASRNDLAPNCDADPVKIMPILRLMNVLGLLVVLQYLQFVVAVHAALDVDGAQDDAVQRLIHFVHVSLQIKTYKRENSFFFLKKTATFSPPEAGLHDQFTTQTQGCGSGSSRLRTFLAGSPTRNF